MLQYNAQEKLNTLRDYMGLQVKPNSFDAVIIDTNVFSDLGKYWDLVKVYKRVPVKVYLQSQEHF